MRSKASQKFNSLHPDSAKDFQNIFKTAKLKKLRESEQFTSSIEVLNMVKNIALTKFREGDDAAKRNKEKVSKKLSWSQNLIEVQFLFDWQQLTRLAIED